MNIVFRQFLLTIILFIFVSCQNEKYDYNLEKGDEESSYLFNDESFHSLKTLDNYMKYSYSKGKKIKDSSSTMTELQLSKFTKTPKLPKNKKTKKPLKRTKIPKPSKVTKVPKPTKPLKTTRKPKPSKTTETTTKVETTTSDIMTTTTSPQEPESHRWFDVFLYQTNRYRNRHGALPLKYNETIANLAQIYAEDLAYNGSPLYHDKDSTYGENLAGGELHYITNTITHWYNEIKYYDFKKPGFNESTKHFTALVWKDTKQVGCGIAQQGQPFYYYDYYVVCKYYPPGNIEGKYKENVLPSLDKGIEYR
uniref:SCP domain-containing protein n=1 Tax=Parastrongyloides trichosuri TaxID=131310 RepID=A0A0N5A6M3_PARTI